jgi:hypoxanthine phosphoribosyltransferase
MINKIVDISKYFNDTDLLIDRVKDMNPDCIVAIMRSGLIISTVISNRLSIPLFVTSQIDSIPTKFKTILLLDDKTYTGKTLRHYNNKFVNKNVIEAVLYCESDYTPEIYIEKLDSQYKMFYEI